MFNTLGVAAVASLAALKPVQLDWWPITRDSLLYTSNILLLIAFAWDNQITLGETITMVVLFVLYFVILFQNKRIMPWMKWFLEHTLNCCRVTSYGKCVCECEVSVSDGKRECVRERRSYLEFIEDNFNIHSNFRFVS